jgi:regulator of nucleoside diphosphate kinase
MPHHITVTHEDRLRLNTMLQYIRATGSAQQEYLDALGVELEHAQEATSEDVPCDVVTMDSMVELSDLKTGEIDAYTIVYPERANIAMNHISVLAPIGTAILGCRVGDVVKVRTPVGRRRIRVEKIHFQPEHANRRLPLESV